jgi:uncharacterized tellurite resistance protein B-like protein
MKDLTEWNKIKFKRNEFSRSNKYEKITPFYVSETLFNFLFDRKVLKEFEKLDDYSACSLLLVSLVMSSDDSIQSIELDRFFTIFSKFNDQVSKKHIDKIVKAFSNKFSTETINKEIIIMVCSDIINNVKDKKDRQNLLFILFSIAIADRIITKTEHSMLVYISRNLGFSDKDIRQLFAFFKGESSSMEFDPYYRWDYSQSSNRINRDRGSFSEQEEEQEEKKKTSNSDNINLFAVNKLHQSLEVLGLSYNATSIEIKNAYKRLARETHPDKMTDKSSIEISIATQRFAKINVAYEYLKSVKRF